MRYRGIMDGWHGDEPEIEDLSLKPWDWQEEPEDEWDDRRRREINIDLDKSINLDCGINLEDGVNVSNFDELNKQIGVLKKMYGDK